MKKPNSTKTMFLVELVLPPRLTETNMCYIIRNALQSEPGIHHPSEPIFDLQTDTIEVKSAGKTLTGLQNAIRVLKNVKKEAASARNNQL